MAKLIAFIFIGLFFAVLLRTRWMWDLNRARREGLYPGPDKKPTLFDVRQLIIKGERDLAVQLYCRIFNTNRTESVKAVQELEKNIKGKKFGH